MMQHFDDKPLPTEQEVTSFEKQIDRIIPEPYRSFVLKHNGGFFDQSDFRVEDVYGGKGLDTSIDCFFGIREEGNWSLAYQLKTYSKRLPKGLFPIGRDPGGSLICISTNEKTLGSLFFWDRDGEASEGEAISNANVYFLAESLDAFITQFK
jgi:SMI1-KNR4 cell-wall